jgi:hypothetical protein
VVAYVRYCQIRIAISKLASESEQTKLGKYNTSCLTIASVASLGTTIQWLKLCNFSQGFTPFLCLFKPNNDLIDVHIIGAFIAFFSFIFYCWTKTFVSYKLRRFLYSTPRVHMARIFLSTLITLNLILSGYIFIANNYLFRMKIVQSQFRR